LSCHSCFRLRRWLLLLAAHEPEDFSGDGSAGRADAPPLRLVLGKYANDKVRKKLADAEKERAAWEHVGPPTDFTPPLPQN